MPHNDWIGLGLYFGFIAVIGLPVILLKVFCNLPFEVTRKLYHLAITLSIYPLVRFFSTWYMAVLAVFLLALLAYPALARFECSSVYRRIAVERGCGEFKRSLIIVQGSMALLLFVFWGLLGEPWKYVTVVAVMAWGLGDAAAAIVGKAIGRRRILNPRIEGKKTYEGTLAMFITAGLAVFFTLLLEGGQSWPVSLMVALLVAPVCATVELFSNRGMDTLYVPISTGLAVLSLMSLFSFLGF
jgi:dolichol kinase